MVQALEKNANSQELATKNENTCRIRIISYITLCQKSYFCPKIEFWRNIRTFRPKNRDFDQKTWFQKFGKSENLEAIFKQFLNNFFTNLGELFIPFVFTIFCNDSPKFEKKNGMKNESYFLAKKIRKKIVKTNERKTRVLKFAKFTNSRSSRLLFSSHSFSRFFANLG